MQAKAIEGLSYIKDNKKSSSEVRISNISQYDNYLPEDYNDNVQWNKLFSDFSITRKIVKTEKDYIFEGKKLGSLSIEIYENIFKAIDKSKYILDLSDDWDDEGAKGYSKSTWILAIGFLLRYLKQLNIDFNINPIVPKIYHAPNSSIDILWETSTCRILINIQDGGERAFFYADNLKDQTTEGSFAINNYNIYLIPLAMQLKSL